MNRTSDFSHIVELTLARTDTWYFLWALFLLVVMVVVYSAHSRIIDFRSFLGIAIAFLLLSGVLVVWLNTVFVQLSALREYASAMVDSSDANALPLETVEVMLERQDQAGLVDAIEPPSRVVWMILYGSLVTGVLCFLLFSYRRIGTKQPNNEDM